MSLVIGFWEQKHVEYKFEITKCTSILNYYSNSLVI